MKLYNITHAADIDGMACAAFLVRYWKVPVSNIVFYGYEKRRMPQLQKQIKRLHPQNGLFVITDVGINREVLKDWEGVLEYLVQTRNRIVWIDHHVWPDDWVTKISKYCDLMLIRESRHYCAAELVLRELYNDGVDSAFKERLANFAHLSDFNIQTRDRRTLARLYRHTWAIRYFNWRNLDFADNNLRKIIAQLANGNFQSRLVDQAYRKYKKHADKQTALLIGSARIIDVNGLRVCIGFAEELHATTACERMMKRFRPKIAIYINTLKGSPRVHFRCVTGLDCSPVAFAFGGGGHPMAAAATLDPKKYVMSRQADRERICTELERSIAKNYARISPARRSR